MKATVSLTLPNGRVIPVLLTTIRREGDWLATAEIATSKGPVKLTAVASEQTARALLEKLGHSVSTAGFLDNVARFAQSDAVKNVLQSVRTVTSNPMLLQAASFYPPAAIALQTVNKVAASAVAAQSLLARYRGGDPKAQQTVRKIAIAAKRGNPRGQKMLRMLDAVNRAQKQQPPVATRPVEELESNPLRYALSWGASTTSGASAEFDLPALIETARRLGPGSN